MEKQDLLDLGMDEELAKKVLIVHAKDIQAANAKTATAEQERDGLKTQLSERDGQLATLKKSAGDNDELKEQIKSLQDANKESTANYEKQLAKQKLDYKIDTALQGAKAKNPTAVKALLKLDNVSVDDKDNLVGLDDQLKGLKESDGYLFGESTSQSTSKKIFPTGNPNGGEVEKTISSAIGNNKVNLTELLSGQANEGE